MKNEVSFYLITDSHYFSVKNWVEGKPVTDRVRDDQIALLQTPEILDTYIEAILADNDADTVVFLGDNIDGGDMNSHYEFRQRLERLSQAGKRVFVTYATHDYIGGVDDECNFQQPRRFTENGIEIIECMRKAQLPDFYYDYTAREAVSVDGESGSYSVNLTDGILLICIIDNGNGRSHCGLFDGGMKWLEEQLAQAERQEKYALVFVHHPVLPPWSIYGRLVGHEMYAGHRELTQLLCRYGVRAVFTGHTHVQGIKKYENANGDRLYDISTCALANAYGCMRKITVDAGSGECCVESVRADIEAKTGMSREQLYRQNFPGIWEELLPLICSDYNGFIGRSQGYLPSDKLRKYRLLISFIGKRLNGMTLYSVARFAGVRKKLSAQERQTAKATPLKAVLFEILRHVYTGNAPYTPETVEYRVLRGATERIDRLNIKKLRSLLGGMTLSEAAGDFLYSETGNDESISFYLK
jgi:3',5'-cyclic AMP phosphodiesterase CpdA